MEDEKENIKECDVLEAEEKKKEANEYFKSKYSVSYIRIFLN